MSASLAPMLETLARLGSVPSRASSNAAETIGALIEHEFASGTDPYDKPWEEHSAATVDRWGEHDVLDLTGKMRGELEVKPLAGAGIAVTFGEPYPAAFHQGGTANMPARPILPDDMPAAWEKALDDAAEAAFGAVE